MNAKILYVEDDLDLGTVTKQYLELMRIDVIWCQSARSAYRTYLQGKYDVIVIDVMLPDVDGFTLAQRILERDKDAYFLFLTARTQKHDKLKGLMMGAIDYMTKPFDIDELVLKIKNMVARQKSAHDMGMEQPKSIIRFGDVCFDETRLSLSVGKDYRVNLTLREAELFGYLCKNRNMVIRREDILVAIWGEDDYFLGRSLDVFISRLRKILSKSRTVRIDNVYGVGFTLSSPE